MEYGVLVVIAICLGGGVAGGVLSAWACHRRLLALETGLKVVLDAHEARLDQLADLVTKSQKREAAKIRWSKKDIEEDALVRDLTLAQPKAVGHPWDPRTWGVGT